jgi:uncharacterized membrane protein YqaE (UPF0057 family)
MEIDISNILIFIIGFEVGMIVALWMDLCKLRKEIK